MSITPETVTPVEPVCPLDGMPPPVEEQWRAIWVEVCNLHATWELLKLCRSVDHCEIMLDAVSSTKMIIRRSLTESIVVGIGRLLDPADEARPDATRPPPKKPAPNPRLNMSLERLVETVSTHLPQTATAFHTELHTFLRQVLENNATWRNKLVCHPDLGYRIGPDRKDPPETPSSHTERSIKLMLGMLNSIHLHFTGVDSPPPPLVDFDGCTLAGILRDWPD